MEPLYSDENGGIEFEPSRKKEFDDNLSNSDDSQSDTQDDLNKDEIRDEIKKIERELENITNTPSYGDDERVSFLETKLDNLRAKLLRDDM